MHKKVLLCSAALMFLALGIGVICIAFFNSAKTTGTFELEDYSVRMDDYVNSFPKEKMPEPLGYVDSYKTAKEKAETVWTDIYGDTIKTEKPFTVAFDEQNQVWMVQGTLPKNWDGGVAGILLQKADGKVLAVWHDK